MFNFGLISAYFTSKTYEDICRTVKSYVNRVTVSLSANTYELFQKALKDQSSKRSKIELNLNVLE